MTSCFRPQSGASWLYQDIGLVEAMIPHLSFVSSAAGRVAAVYVISIDINTHHVNGNIRMCKMPPFKGPLRQKCLTPPHLWVCACCRCGCSGQSRHTVTERLLWLVQEKLVQIIFLDLDPKSNQMQDLFHWKRFNTTCYWTILILLQN